MTVIADELQQYAALQIVKIGLDKLCDLSLKSPDMYITDLCIVTCCIFVVASVA